MSEFSVGAFNYKTNRKLDVFTQGHITRRLAPLFAGVAASFDRDEMKLAGPTETAEKIGAAVLGNLGPVTEALASLSDADVDYVLKRSLAAVSRQLAGATGWTPILSSGGDLMFEDIDLIQLYQIVWKVLQESLGGFLSALGEPGAGAGTA